MARLERLQRCEIPDMRTMRRFTVLFITTMAVGLFGALPARAEMVCHVYDKWGKCTLEVNTAPTPGGGDRRGDADGTVTVKGEECRLFVSLLDPQPSPDDPSWEGHYPEGHVYRCQVNEKRSIRFWSPELLGGPSPRELAQRAVDEMEMVAPEVGLTGYGGPESMQVLGLPTWMWIADPGESTTGPITRSASVGGMTVTATAQLRETVWHMGDGGVVTCLRENAAGTPYADSYNKAPSPTCGYRYTRTSANQPAKAYTVTVTSNWEIGWSGGGQSGVITMSLAQSTQLRVGEVQVIVNGSGQDKL